MGIKEEDIDLKLIFDRILTPFFWLGAQIAATYRSVCRRWIMVTFLALLGAGAGWTYYLITPPTYSATLVLTSKDLGNEFCAGEIKNLNALLRDQSYSRLSEVIKIDEQSAKNLKSIEFENYDEGLLEEDTIASAKPFKVVATVYNNRVFPDIKTGIVNYLENNPYAKTRKEIRKSNLITLQNKFTNEILELDSLKEKLSDNLMPRGGNGFIFGQPIDPLQAHKEAISIFRSELEIKNELALLDNIQVIQDFFPKEKPDHPKLRSSIALFTFLGLMLGSLLARFLEMRKSGK